MNLSAILIIMSLGLFSCSSNQEKTQDVFTDEDNYYDYNYYEDPVDPLTSFSTPYTRPEYQEPETYYEEVQMMQDFSDVDEGEDFEEVEKVERKGPRGFLYEDTPPPKASEWFFEDY